MLEAEIIWQQCTVLLKEQFGEQDFNTWFKQLNVEFKDNKLQIYANNRLVQDFIKNKYWSKVNQILEELTGGISVELLVRQKVKSEISEIVNPVVKVATNEEVNKKDSAARVKNKTSKELAESLHQATKLNPDYNFDTLVKGNSNQLAYAIGLHVTQKPGQKNHNPLFIYGGVGLGKTHLMQAIGNERHKINANTKIRYLHANDYIQDVVKASMRQGFDELKKYYNGLDLLLMDDIQFIAGDKTKTQEEFFYTFNTLLDKDKQVIMTCDTFPKNINNLNERLISRFASGLTVEIQPPELEMRVAILKRKAEQSEIVLDDDVAFFIAQNIKSNVRELEGALNKVIYHAHFSEKGITIAIAKEALMDIFALDSRAVSIDDIQKTICAFYKLKISELLSSKRTQKIVRPRQIAMALAKELTQLSLPAIGNAFGGRDHTTVIHAQKTVMALRQEDDKLDKEYKILIQMLNN
ncbi:MAG: chromosomal replication initiator protein DnaA [Burkholderiales bacterium]|nr:chromosomal replication initiator protein DnaA [Burkholderiales bacterium]